METQSDFGVCGWRIEISGYPITRPTPSLCRNLLDTESVTLSSRFGYVPLLY
jgi:hypothetical protein